jgi:hypothetical protein
MSSALDTKNFDIQGAAHFVNGNGSNFSLILNFQGANCS